MDFESMTVELTDELAVLMAQVAIPNNFGKLNKEDIQNHIKVAERQQKLAQFCLDHQIQLFPFPEKLLIVYDGEEKHLIPQVLTVWDSLYDYLPLEIITAKEEWEAGQVKLRPVSKKLTTKALQNYGGGSYKATEWETTPWSNTLEGIDDVPKVYARHFASWFLIWSVFQMRNLTPLQMADLVVLLRPELEKAMSVEQKGEQVKVGFLVEKENDNFYFSLSAGTISASRGSDRQLNWWSSILATGCPSLPLMLPLLVLLGSKRYQGSVAACLNELPNLWFREANYGHKWEQDHPTRLIVSNTLLPMGAVYRDVNRNCLNLWPFCLLTNSKFSSDLVEALVVSEGMVSTDKYNMQMVIGPVGTQAMGLWMSLEEDKWKSIHDASKESKLPNRPTQARKYNCAYSRLLLEDGTVVSDRAASSLRVTIKQ